MLSTFAANKFYCCMKNIFLFFALLSALLLSSCKKMEPSQNQHNLQEQTSTLTISLEGVDANITTRASTLESGTDKTATSTQIFIFEPSGNSIEKLTTGGTINLARGYKYTVAAIINGPTINSPTLASLRTTELDLKTYPFVMYKEAFADLTTSPSAVVNLNVSSLASRVRVTNIQNNLHSWLGPLNLSKIYLCNVVGTARPDGSERPICYNWYGRSALATPVTDSSLTGSVDNSTPAAAYTLKESDISLLNGENFSSKASAFALYCFPNNNRAEMDPNGYSGNAANQDLSTWLTICGTVKGRIYYWTVNLGHQITGSTGLAANYTYDVSITINNLGSSNPTLPVVPGSADISCNIAPWLDGGHLIADI